MSWSGSRDATMEARSTAGFDEGVGVIGVGSTSFYSNMDSCMVNRLSTPVRYSFAPSGLVPFLVCTHGLRRGLYSFATTRLCTSSRRVAARVVVTPVNGYGFWCRECAVVKSG